MMNRPRSLLWLTGAAVVAVLAGVGVWLAVRGGGTSTTQPPITTRPPAGTATAQPPSQAPPDRGAATTLPAATSTLPAATSTSPAATSTSATSTSPPPPVLAQPPVPRKVSEAELISLAKALGHPIYWAGAEQGYTYELTRSSSGSIYVGYLPPGVKIGDGRAVYLIVATYPIPGAFAAIKRQAGSGGAGLIRLAGGGLALVDATSPETVHVAFPGSGLEAEVFDPSPARARQLVSSGKISALG